MPFYKRYLFILSLCTGPLLILLYAARYDRPCGISLALLLSGLFLYTILSFRINKKKNSNGPDILEMILKENKPFLTKALDMAHIGFWKWDIRDDTWSFSSEAYKIIGISHEGHDNGSNVLFQYAHSNDKPSLLNLFNDKQNNGSCLQYEFKIIRPDGSLRFVYLQGNMVYDKKGNLTNMLGILQDMTERKKTGEDLLRLKKAIDTTRLGITISDTEKKIVYVNPAEAIMHGYEAEELIGKDVTILAPHDLKQHEKPKFDSKKSVFIRESINIKKDGTRFPVQLISDVLRDENDAPIAVITTCEDITNRKDIERTLRESEEKYRNLVESIEIGIGMVDENEIFQFANTAACSILGYTRDELIGKDLLDLVSPELRPKILKETKTRKKNISNRYIIDMIRKDGEKITIVNTSTPVFDENGRYKGARGIFRDITEQIRTETALKESEKKYRSLIEISPDAIVLIDKNGTLQSANRQFVKLSGFGSLEDLQNSGLSVFDFICGQDRNRAIATIQETLKKGHTKDIEYSARRKDGRIVPIEVSSAVIYDPSGNIDIIELIIRDISKRKEDEKAIRESEEKFRALAENSLDVIMRFDKDHRHLYANPAVESQTGVPVKDFIGRTHREMGFPDDLIITWEKALDKVFQTGGPHRIEFKLPNGIWIDWLLLPEFDIDGSVSAVITYARDITQKKQIEQALKDNEEILRFLVESSPLPLIMTKPGSGKIIKFNQALCDMFGHTKENIQTINDLYAFPEKDMPKIIKELQENGRIVQKEIMARKADGTVFDILLSVETGNFLNETVALAVVYDLTERKKLEDNLHKAKEEAEFHSKAKSQFLANMSHELRTPLTAILGYTQILRRNPDIQEHQDKLLKIIERSGNHLLNLINDILDIAKIEAQKMKLAPAKINFFNFLEHISDMIEISAKDKNISFMAEFDNDLPQVIYADEKRLSQILLNLLGNAVKFTHSGSVFFRVKKQNGYKNHVCFIVEDTGIGIPEDKINDIFSPFKQAYDKKDSTEGTGLGLPISKTLVEMMGGEIFVESIFGEKSRFWFYLCLPDLYNGGTEKTILKKAFNPANIIHPASDRILRLLEYAQIGDLEKCRSLLEEIKAEKQEHEIFFQEANEFLKEFRLRDFKRYLNSFIGEA